MEGFMWKNALAALSLLVPECTGIRLRQADEWGNPANAVAKGGRFNVERKAALDGDRLMDDP